MRILEFRVLGPVEALRDGVLIPLGRGRLPTLLASLLLHPNETVAADSLAEMVWDTDLPEHPRAALASGLSRLRRLLGDDVIDTVPEGYRLRVEPDRLDLLRFRHLIAVARGAGAGAYEDAVAALDEAIGLWREPVLRNVRSAVLDREVLPELVERYLEAQEDRAELCLLLGRHAVVVSELPTLVRQYPYRERMVGLLMVALYRSGRQADSLAAYERLRTALGQELGIDPGAALQNLHVEILRADPRLDGKPLAPAEHDREPRPATATVPPRQLPAVMGPLYGREQALADLDRGLAEAGSGPLLVSIVGPGGIGKTALAVRWAHQVADRFPEGQLYLDLRGYGPDTPLTLAGALERLLRSFTLDPAQIPADVEGRASLLRSLLGERRMLIVLDNARDSEQVRPLLPGSACAVVVTSRNQMRALTARDGARRVSLAPIDVDAAAAVLAAATGRTAEDFALDEVADLVELCAGLPLAIRVTAERLARDLGRSDLGSVNLTLRDRSGRLDELDSGDGELTDLRAVLSWSYEALDPEAARAFRLVATQPGSSIGLAAAASLLGASQHTARRLLDRLAGVHLIEQPRHDRYAMHDLLRAYGVERSRIDGADEHAIRRLYDWYLRTAVNARDQLYRRPVTNRIEPPPSEVTPLEFTDVKEAQDWFDLEYPVLVTIIDHAAGHGHEEHAWKAVWALWEYFYRRKLWDSWAATHETGLAAARRCGSRSGEMQMLDGLGSLYEKKDLWEKAIELRTAALKLAREDHNRYREASILQNMGVAYYIGGDLARSHEYLRDALVILDDIDDAPDRTTVLNNLGELLNAMGRHAEAIDHLGRGLAHIRHSETDRSFSVLIDNLGLAYAGLGDHETAIEHFQLALESNRRYRYRPREASNLAHLGDALFAMGDREAAMSQWKEALPIYVDLGMPGADEMTARINGDGRTCTAV
jgi:DNA-binding SARP family transcriptional activator